MKLNFTNDSLNQAQTNGIPSQKKISGCKKRIKLMVCWGFFLLFIYISLSQLNRTINPAMVILSTFPTLEGTKHTLIPAIRYICCSIFAYYQLAMTKLLKFQFKALPHILPRYFRKKPN